jgi:hypothetical protein
MRTVFMTAAAILFASALAEAAPTTSRVVSVTVTRTRVHLGDLVGGLPDGVADADLGPAPTTSGTRFITRDDVTAALREQGSEASVSLPDGFRVGRRMKVLSPSDLTRMVGESLGNRLPRGASLGSVHVSRAVTVPDGFTELRCEVPHPPHRTGVVQSTAKLSFYSQGEPIWTLQIPVDLVLSQDAVPYDVPRGTHVSLVLRRGLIEVRASGTVTTDSDVGDLAPVSVTSSGRLLSARVVDAETVVMVDRP